mmetsp:Transcript_22731/g.35601  ORF Transcript_22731/g.35601 Transcript_22731/m.35601 type:complete len:114 (-) Transcript_22731:256-597(-)
MLCVTHWKTVAQVRTLWALGTALGRSQDLLHCNCSHKLSNQRGTRSQKQTKEKQGTGWGPLEKQGQDPGRQTPAMGLGNPTARRNTDSLRTDPSWTHAESGGEDPLKGLGARK